MDVANIVTDPPEVKSSEDLVAQPSWRACVAVDPLAANMPPIAPEDFEALVADIAEHGIRNEVTLFRDDVGGDFVLDGCNRLDAAERAGRLVIKDGALNLDVVPVRYVHGNTDRKKYVRAQNFLRRHLNAEQKREAIGKLLAENPERSDRDIGREAGADHKTVASERLDLETRGEIPHTKTRKDKGGRVQPAHKPKRDGADDISGDQPAALAENEHADHAGRNRDAGDVEPDENVEEPKKVLVNILDTIEQQKAVGEAYRKILKVSPFDRGAKKEISEAIVSLIKKWRAVQSILTANHTGPLVNTTFEQVSGADILARVPEDKLAAFLDALTADGALKAATPEFKRDLRAKLPTNPGAWLVEKDTGTIAATITEKVGSTKATAIAVKLHALVAPKGKSNKPDKSNKSNKPVKAMMLMEPTGTDASGNPIFAHQPRGNRSRAH